MLKKKTLFYSRPLPFEDLTLLFKLFEKALKTPYQMIICNLAKVQTWNWSEITSLSKSTQVKA